MLRRKVVKVVANEGSKRYALELECGHIARRRDSGTKKPPKSTYCDDCVIVLERLERADGLVSAKDIKSSKAALRFLEAEGLVESRRSIGAKTVYWKRTRSQPCS